MIEVKRKEGENTLSVLRRFTKKVQQSGNLRLVKGLRFSKRAVSRLVKKRNALKRFETKKHYAEMEKLGKTPAR